MSDKTKRSTKSTIAKAEVISDMPALELKTTKIDPVAEVTSTISLNKAIQQEKHKKPKMVRDSFSMPEADYAQIGVLKERCLKAGVSAKKSEVLRAALKCLSNLPDKAVTKAIADLEIIKTGRPSKN